MLDHLHYAEWLDLDDVSLQDRNKWLKATSKLASNMSFVQAYTSGFNHVRQFQQRTAVMGMADKVMRTLKDGTALERADLQRRFESDFGLGLDELDEFMGMIESGVIEFDPSGRFVNKLNISQWRPELAETFGAAMRRNVNQVVQKSMAGEQLSSAEFDLLWLLAQTKSQY